LSVASLTTGLLPYPMWMCVSVYVF
jgi:hypothetical protein